MNLNEKEEIASEIIFELEMLESQKGLDMHFRNNLIDLSTPQKIFENMIATFPVNSLIYKDFRTIFEDCYLKKLYPAEHVVVLPKWNPYPDFYQNKVLSTYFLNHVGNKELPTFKILPRWQVEYNPEYVQLVVASLIRYGDSFVLLQSGKESSMEEGIITMVQGHASYRYGAEVNFMFESENVQNTDFQSSMFKSYLFDEIQREAKEEIGCDIEPIFNKGDLQWVYIPPDPADMTAISYYHMGIVFFSRVAKGLPGEKEPTKNKLHMIKGNCGLNLLKNDETIDKWLVKAIESFIPPTNKEE